MACDALAAEIMSIFNVWHNATMARCVKWYVLQRKRHGGQHPAYVALYLISIFCHHVSTVFSRDLIMPVVNKISMAWRGAAARHGGVALKREWVGTLPVEGRW